MNKTLIAAALAAGFAATGAQAQGVPTPAGVTLYGLVDAGVEHITNVGPGKSSLTRMLSLTGSLPSRWGLRGSEDLGGGLRALFTLESGFSPDTGGMGQGGRLFGRQAWVGLAGNWGTVSLGRQYTMLYWSLLDADQLGPNNYGLGSLDSYIPNTRADNSLAYRGSFSGLTLGATYSLGRDTVSSPAGPASTGCGGENAADKSACREWSVLAKYDTANWGVALANDELRGGAGSWAPANLLLSSQKDRRTTLNGYAKFGAFKVTAGVIRRSNDGAAAISAANGAGRRSDLWWVGGAYSITPAFVLDGQVQRLDFKDGGDASTLTAVRGTYNLSKRTAAYAQVAHISNGSRLTFSASGGQAGSNPLAGVSQNAVMVGVKHAF